MEVAYTKILGSILSHNPATKQEFNTARKKVCSNLKIQFPSNKKLLHAYRRLIKSGELEPSLLVEQFLRKADIRTLSGISVITSLVKPYMCPGKCVYCPTEVRMPKSYIASEPAAARALALKFSPYEQMRRRIEALEENGHHTDKIEFIIKGGTWNAYPLTYQYWFILESFRACNDLSREVPTRPYTEEMFTTTESIQEALLKEHTYNETAKHRIIGLTVETRPDAITPRSIHHMRVQGCTRLELGLQAPDDKILSLIKRGHTVQQFKDAIRLLRYAGFKVDLHFMPDLPGTTPEHDVEMYQQIFDDEALRPDMIKIYPCTVIKTAELNDWYERGVYKPYEPEQLFEALLKMKKATPRYCRISRLIRDIPAPEITAGNKITNLRQELKAELKKRNEICECLRCREIGRNQELMRKKPYLCTDTYRASDGTELFMSFEDKDRNVVFAFLRLRLPDLNKDPQDILYNNRADKLTTLMPETKDVAFIRELHTYGHLVKIGKNNETSIQHRGLGKRLVKEAEKIVKHAGYNKIAIISGVGVREYYKKLGYELEGTYMTKCV